jgi:hypothetical protein
MYPGVGLNTLANPVTVSNEEQVITTSVNDKTPEIQQVEINSLTTNNFAMSILGYQGGYTLTSASTSGAIKTYVQDRLTEASWTTPTVTVSAITCDAAGCGTKMTFTVQYDTYDGPVEKIVATPAVAATGATSLTTTTQVGTSVIGGTFSLSFNGTRSVDMVYNVAPGEMKTCLEDLPGVGTVSVTRNSVTDGSGNNRNAFTWTVTFDATSGNLPLIYPTPGRLTPLSSNVGITVAQKKAGSDSIIVYDGTGVSDLRTVTVSNLISDMTYAFKSVPINALGDGILSAPSVTVVTSSGASASYLFVFGPQLKCHYFRDCF